MARRRSYKKSSKCPEPINTMIDIAGATALGLFVRSKVKSDFEKGRGDDSAKAAGMVFGYGAMRGGTRGILGLGGLMGLNSALKSIEKQSQMRHVIEPPFVDKISENKCSVKPLRKNMWREHCEDGEPFGLNPYDFSSADEYDEAIRNAKQKQNKTIKNSINENSETKKTINSIDKRVDKKEGLWRHYCSDGTVYGIDPNDYDNADDYEDAIIEAKNKNT